MRAELKVRGALYLTVFYLLDALIIWNPTQVHFFGMLDFFYSSVYWYLHGSTLHPWFNYSQIDYVFFWFALVYFFLILFIIPIFLYSVFYKKKTPLQTIKELIPGAVILPVFIFVWEWLMQATYLPIRLFWFGFLGEAGGIIALLAVIFLAVIASGGSASHSSGIQTANHENLLKLEHSDNSRKKEIKIASFTEKVSDPIDHMVSYISQSEDAPPQYKTTIREGDREYIGFGRDQEESKRNAHESQRRGNSPW